ncbi:phosphonate metabolism protein/1,5-bisphosphokinase (PRPP-forming) PhnN [Antarctobacter sp.]|uniref:phosphonate metabolism protein/1,5-bisphosphokinase (PRPP-forming) PhnN n=1 Tax=Antarctobacter sp. TaxID=1872577 RepID=UPI002B273B44|nr:phosphonate metabolism protein/1,5-bisphosphokinase (PRPP-forming) PhnN [Antarctobacter sp.]
MMAGRFIAVVGPSGVGKDSVMAALAARDPRFVVARRMITRPEEAGGEDHTGVSGAEFDRIETDGGFALSWRAHRLSYGIPTEVDADIAKGRDVLANLSRGVLARAQARFDRFAVLSLTAPVEVLAQRLAGRGRETADQIADRLGRTASPLPNGLPVISVENTGPLEQTVDTILTRLQPQRV